VRAVPLNLLLIRHGVTDWNEAGRLMGRAAIGLNARGLEQATALAETLRPAPLRLVLASPQRRALETAAPIAAAHALPVRSDAGLDEVWLGRWQGKTWTDLRDDPDLQQYVRDPAYVCDAIEPAAAVQQRIVATVEHLRGVGHTGAVAIISHGDPIKLVLAHYLSMALPAFRCLTIDNGSVSVLRFDASADRRLLLSNWRAGAALWQMLSCQLTGDGGSDGDVH